MAEREKPRECEGDQVCRNYLWDNQMWLGEAGFEVWAMSGGKSPGLYSNFLFNQDWHKSLGRFMRTLSIKVLRTLENRYGLTPLRTRFCSNTVNKFSFNLTRMFLFATCTHCIFSQPEKSLPLLSWGLRYSLLPTLTLRGFLQSRGTRLVVPQPLLTCGAAPSYEWDFTFVLLRNLFIYLF